MVARDFDPAIVVANARVAEAAQLVSNTYGQHGPWERQHIEKMRHALAEREAAVAAKFEAERPKRLSLDAALTIYNVKAQNVPDGTLPHRAAIQEVLDIAHAQMATVIKALPSYRYGRTQQEVERCPHGCGAFIEIDAVCAALKS